MEDNGEGRKIEASPMSNKLRWDTILAFITSSDDDAFLKRITEEKEKRKRKFKDEDYEDQQILEFKKTGLSCLKGVQCFVQREMERLMRNEVEEEEGFIPLKTHIPKRKRTMPADEEEEKHTTIVPDYIRKTTTITTIQCFQGSSSKSVTYQDEHRVIQDRQQPKKDRRYYDQLHKQQIANKFKKPRPVVRQQAPAPAPAPKPKIKSVRLAVQPAKLPPVPQSIPGNIKEAIDEGFGTNITWLSQKVLTHSDIKRSQNRLFLPSDCEALLNSIMTDDEKRAYVVTKDNKKGLKTKVIDSELKVWDMDFKYWPSLEQIVFTGNWTKLVARLGLVPGNTVQIWCFRVPAGPDMKLCFAINIVRQPVPAPAPEPEMDEM